MNAKLDPRRFTIAKMESKTSVISGARFRRHDNNEKESRRNSSSQSISEDSNDSLSSNS